MTSTSEADDFGSAVMSDAGIPLEAPGAPGAALAPGGPPAKVRKYPTFHPEDWKDHPLAKGINKTADKLGKLEPGTASDDCNLGEAYLFCIDYYLGGKLEDVPPWVPALMATVHLGVLAVPAYLDAKRQDAADASTADDEISRRLAKEAAAAAGGKKA